MNEQKMIENEKRGLPVQREDAPCPVSPEQERCLERIETQITIHVASGIEIGKELISLKKITPHGHFTKLVEWRFGIKKMQQSNYIRIASRFGNQKSTAVDFSTKALLELAKAPSPEDALAEANKLKDQGESITAKQAREIAELHKKIEAEKKRREALLPNVDNLIPELLRMHNSGSLPKATCLEFSKLDHDIQRYVVLPKMRAEKRLMDQLAELEVERTRALERESKAREEAELAKKDLAAMEGETIRQILAKKNEEILAKQKELGLLEKQMERGIRDKVEEKIRKEIEEAQQKKMENLRKAKEKAEREMRDSLSGARARSMKITSLEKKNKELEERLELSMPKRVDEKTAMEMKRVRDSVEIALKSVERTAREHGALMDKTLEVIVEISRLTARFVEKQAGDTIIDI